MTGTRSSRPLGVTKIVKINENHDFRWFPLFSLFWWLLVVSTTLYRPPKPDKCWNYCLNFLRHLGNVRFRPGETPLTIWGVLSVVVGSVNFMKFQKITKIMIFDDFHHFSTHPLWEYKLYHTIIKTRKNMKISVYELEQSHKPSENPSEHSQWSYRPPERTQSRQRWNPEKSYFFQKNDAITYDMCLIFILGPKCWHVWPPYDLADTLFGNSWLHSPQELHLSFQKSLTTSKSLH